MTLEDLAEAIGDTIGMTQADTEARLLEIVDDQVAMEGGITEVFGADQVAALDVPKWLEQRLRDYMAEAAS